MLLSGYRGLCTPIDAVFVVSETPSSSYSANVPLTNCSINPLFNDCDVYAQNFWQVFFNFWTQMWPAVLSTSEHKFTAVFRLQNDLDCVGWGIELYSFTSQLLWPLIFCDKTLTFSEKMDIATLTMSSNTKRTPKLQGCSRINKQMLSVHTALALKCWYSRLFLIANTMAKLSTAFCLGPYFNIYAAKLGNCGTVFWCGFPAEIFNLVFFCRWFCQKVELPCFGLAQQNGEQKCI